MAECRQPTPRCSPTLLMSRSINSPILTSGEHVGRCPGQSMLNGAFNSSGDGHCGLRDPLDNCAHEGAMESYLEAISHVFQVGLRPIGDLAKWAYSCGMKTREMTDKFQDWQKQAKEQVREAGEAADHYVRENTWQTLAFAAVFGCIIGFLLARRD